MEGFKVSGFRFQVWESSRSGGGSGGCMDCATGIGLMGPMGRMWMSGVRLCGDVRG